MLPPDGPRSRSPPTICNTLNATYATRRAIPFYVTPFDDNSTRTTEDVNTASFASQTAGWPVRGGRLSIRGVYGTRIVTLESDLGELVFIRLLLSFFVFSVCFPPLLVLAVISPLGQQISLLMVHDCGSSADGLFAVNALMFLYACFTRPVHAACSFTFGILGAHVAHD